MHLHVEQRGVGIMPASPEYGDVWMPVKLPARMLPGESLRSREVAGLRLIENAYPAGLSAPVHWHAHAWICFVLKGGYTETRGARSRECPPSTLFFHPGDYAHSACQHADGRCFNIELAPRWLEWAQEYGLALDEPVDSHGGRPAGLAARLCEEFQAEDAASGLAIEGLTLELLAEASRSVLPVAERRRPHWLERVRELLAARFAESLTPDEIAAAVGVHPVHLARVFRQHYHCSLGGYVRRLRLEFATRELCASDTPLLDIALAAGYCDQSHFSKNFKRHTGMSPARFRQNCRPR
jgi:AraC family transcriptional regulator